MVLSGHYYVHEADLMLQKPKTRRYKKAPCRQDLGCSITSATRVKTSATCIVRD